MVSQGMAGCCGGEPGDGRPYSVADLYCQIVSAEGYGGEPAVGSNAGEERCSQMIPVRKEGRRGLLGG